MERYELISIIFYNDLMNEKMTIQHIQEISREYPYYGCVDILGTLQCYWNVHKCRRILFFAVVNGFTNIYQETLV